MSYTALLLAIVPVFAVIAAGWGARRIGWLTREADGSLLRLVVSLLYPALIFETVVGNEAARALTNLAWGPPLGFAAITIGFLLAAITGRLAGIRDPARLGTFVFTVGIFNYGYLPVPILTGFHPETLGVLFVFNLGVELAIWTVGIAIVAGNDGRPWYSRLLNPSVIALVSGVALNLLGGDAILPPFLLTTIRMLGACSIPLGLMLIGATLADELAGGAPRTTWTVPALACGLRLLVLPLLFLAAAVFLPASEELRRVLVVQAGMPCGILPIVLAKHHRGDVPTALWVVLGTTALGLFLAPFWIRAGLLWTGIP